MARRKLTQDGRENIEIWGKSDRNHSRLNVLN